MTLAAYQDKFRRLNVNVRAGRASPHKICMLLALLDLARSGGLADNRILLPSGEAMVEAAHIHPFSAAGDDDPRNGLALTPDMHWAMDRHLIAPGPDLKWHVSRVLDRRIPDFARLTSLQGQPLFLPREPRFTPKRESLAWRLEQLRRHAS